MALSPENLLKGGSPYSECIGEEITSDCQNKIGNVCKALRDTMTKIDESKYCKAIVLSHAR